MSHPENFNTPEETSKNEKGKSQILRRTLLIGGIGAGITAIVGGGSVIGKSLANYGNEAPTPEPAPKPPVESETPTETEVPVETEKPSAETPTEVEPHVYGGIETDQSYEDFVEAMKFQPGMTDEELANKFLSAYNFAIMGNTSETVYNMFEEDSSGYTNLLEDRTDETANAFGEAMFGEGWRSDSGDRDRRDFIAEVSQTGYDSAMRWIFTRHESNEGNYVRSIELGAISSEDISDMQGGTFKVLTVKGIESVDGDYIDASFLDDIDEEILDRGKVRGFRLYFKSDSENEFGRPVLNTVSWHDSVANA